MKSTILVMLLFMSCALYSAQATTPDDFHLDWKQNLRERTGLRFHHDMWRVPNTRESADILYSAFNLSITQKEVIPRPPGFPCGWIVEAMVGESADGGVGFVQFAECPDGFPNVDKIQFEHRSYLVNHVDYIPEVIDYLITKRKYKMEIPLMCDPGNTDPNFPREPKCESCLFPPDDQHGFKVCVGAFTPVCAQPPSPPPPPQLQSTTPRLQSTDMAGDTTPLYATRGVPIAYRYSVHA